MSVPDNVRLKPIEQHQPRPTGLGDNLVLRGFELLHRRRGNVFQLPLPGFSPTVFVGPDAVRQVLVTSRHSLLWRTPSDPVTQLLGHGVLVTDGEEHDHLRGLITPWLHKRHFSGYAETMVAETDRVMALWPEHSAVNMVDEMRRISLLILFRSLFGVDVWADLPILWRPIFEAIHVISPGAWLIWPGASRLRRNRHLYLLDEYLVQLITDRRRHASPPADLLTHLIESGLDDGAVRDQMLTLLIAGHDTNTALMSWTLALLGRHPGWMGSVHEQIDRHLGDRPPALEDLPSLSLLDHVIQESLRLYPPIHLGNRLASEDLHTPAGTVSAGERVVYSIYLTQRDPEAWVEPSSFLPERFNEARPAEPYAYVPFGGGQRNCVGAAFGKVEAATVLARVLQRRQLHLEPSVIRPHMGATLMPHPAVRMRTIERRL